MQLCGDIYMDCINMYLNYSQYAGFFPIFKVYYLNNGLLVLRYIFEWSLSFFL